MEQIPLGTLFTKARAVDVVVAVDASADDSNQWPKSVTVFASYECPRELNARQWNNASDYLAANLFSSLFISSSISSYSIVGTGLCHHGSQSKTNVLWV